MRRGHRHPPNLLVFALCGLCGLLVGCGDETPGEGPALDLGTLDESGDPPAPEERLTVGGGESPSTPPPSPTEPEADDKPDPDEVRSPENLAASVLDALASAYQELGRLLESEDDDAAVKEGWAEIKATLTRAMREASRHRLRLDAKGRARMRKLVMAGRPAAVRPHYESVERGVRRFEKTDVPLTTELVQAHSLLELAFGG